MYSIILFRTRKESSLKKYRFLFLAPRVREKLEICYWEEEQESFETMARELNARTREYSEWKLFLYDELCGNEEPDDAAGGLIEIFSGSGGRGGQKVEGAFPAQLWYIQRQEKEYVPLRTGTALTAADRERRFGGNFRIFRFRMDSSNGRRESHDEFRLCCALLAAAYGQIPYTFTDAGYLYDLDIEIDSGRFAEYVILLNRRLNRIRDRYEEERENLKRRRRTVMPFPRESFPAVCLEEGGRKGENGRNGRLLTFREMLGCGSVERILKQNRDFLEERMCYPKGVLREEKKRLRDLVGEMEGTDSFLDEVGGELLHKRIYKTLVEMGQRKDARFRQQKFEQDVRRAEELIRTQNMRMMKRKERIQVLSLCTLLEMLVFEPYVILGLYGRGGLQCTAIACLAAAAGIGIFIYLVYDIYLRGQHRASWGFYRKQVFERLSAYRLDKREYLEDILALLLRFQYYEKIKTEQRQLLMEWERDRDRLEHHSRMLDNGFLEIGPLLYLLEEAQSGEALEDETINIVFGEEPREEDYYQLSSQKEHYMEINHSGYMVRTAYDFFVRISIRKAIHNEQGGDLIG